VHLFVVFATWIRMHRKRDHFVCLKAGWWRRVEDVGLSGFRAERHAAQPDVSLLYIEFR